MIRCSSLTADFFESHFSMRQIGTLSSENHASIFNDYLLTRGIKAMVEAEGDEWVVWIYDEDQIVQAKEELATFLENSDDPLYRKVAQTAKEVRRETEKLNKQVRKQVVNVRERWSRPLAAQIPLTMSLIVMSILATMLCQFGEKIDPIVSALGFARFLDEGNGGWYLPTGSSGFEQIQQGEIWRLVTPIFLHLSIWHLLFNMYWTFMLGRMVEWRLKTLRYALMVLVLAVTSNFTQAWISGPAGGGMSGVGYGLFGYIWMKSRFDPESGLYLEPQTVFLFIAWFFICMTGAFGPIGNTAHGVGLGVGMALGYAPKLWRDMQRRA